MRAVLLNRKSLVRITFFFVIILFGTVKDIYSQKTIEISASDFRAKVEGYWYGQLVGNYMGFPFELVYNSSAIPRDIDRYYNAGDLDSLDLNMQENDRRAYIHIMADALGGAWSDDDTDIEFVTLHAVEKYGLDINYEEITEMWKNHINRFIWVSNQKARELMDEGLIPPATGSKENNPYWNQIDPQLVNEIWSIFYPAMISQARDRAEWGAKITNDDYGTHATEAYAVMYSAAFFESNTDTLVQMAIDSLPDNSPYKEGMIDVVDWYNTYSDWRDTREKIHNKYYNFQNYGNWQPLSSVTNGLCGIMAILYGEGDFLKTTSIAVSAGYDCDNQAATCAGLMGVINGVDVIPEELLLNVPSRNAWTEPFNDQYINYSRDGLPNYTSISSIIDRIIAISEEAIVENGGEIVGEQSSKYYIINTGISKSQTGFYNNETEGDRKEGEFKLYPNPTNNHVRIDFTNPTKVQKIIITAQNGQAITSIDVNDIISEYQISKMELKSGKYILSVVTDLEVVSKLFTYI